jgi:hypothetical protein
MNKLICMSTALAFSTITYAQKIKVKESNENIGGGNHNAFVVNMYEISPSEAEDAFKSYVKKYGGKRSSDNGIFVDNASIKDMSNNTVDIYGRATGKSGDKEISFIVAFDLGGAFLNSKDHKNQFDIAEKMVREFAIESTQEIIEKQLKDNQKTLSKLENEQKSLEKENGNLNDDITEYKDKIKKAEQDLQTNKSSQDKKKMEIDAQKKVVDEVDKKLKAVN